MDKRVVSVMIMALIATSGLTIFANASTITVATDKTYYVPGEDVEITGATDANKYVLINVSNPLGLVYSANVSSGAEGEYHTSFHLSSSALYGEYEVTATLNSDSDTEAQTSFTVGLRMVRDLAEKLVSMAQSARSRVEAVLDQLEEEGIEVPEEATESYNNGVEAHEEAKAKLEDEDYQGAIGDALQALQEFHTALRLAKAVEREEEQEDRGKGLEVAIERAYEFMERLNETAKRLEDEEGIDVDQVRGNLTEAKEHLDNALELLESGDVEGAAQELAEARGILGRTMALLHHIAKKFKIAKTERFLEHSQNRIENMIQWLRRRGFGLTQHEVDSAISALMNVGMRLGQIRNRLSLLSGDDELEDLREAIEELNESGANMTKREIMMLYSWTERIEARIRVLNASLEKMKQKGLDTESIEAELDEAKGLLEQIRDQLQAGDIESVKNLLESADSLLDNIDNLFRESRRREMSRGNHEEEP